MKVLDRDFGEYGGCGGNGVGGLGCRTAVGEWCEVWSLLKFL